MSLSLYRYLLCLTLTFLTAPTAYPCTQVTFRLAEESDPNVRTHDRAVNDHARYILKGFAGEKAGNLLRESGSDLTLGCGDLSQAAQNALDDAAPRGDLTLDGLRDAWQTYALEAREGLGYALTLPDRWSDFLTVTNYRLWEKTVVAASRVKRAKRVLYRSPAHRLPRLSVAETHPHGTPEGAAPREVEVAVVRLDGGGDWDFYVYGPDGSLAPESEFPAGPQPAPTFCQSCHYDVMARRFHRFLPDSP